MAEPEEESGGTNGEWGAIATSAGGLFSGFISEGFASKSSSQLVNGGDASRVSVVEKAGEFPMSSEVKVGEDGSGNVEFSSDISMESTRNWKFPAVRNGGSIAERRSAWCGFSAPRINTARFRTTSPSPSPRVRSPYLTIPPGLSPTALLDSPVMLSNSQAQPSPTTGTFPLPPLSHESSMPVSATPIEERDKDDAVDSSFIFKPQGSPVSLPCVRDGEYPSVGMFDANHRAVSSLKSQEELQGGYLKQAITHEYANNFHSDMEASTNLTVNGRCIVMQSCQSGVAGDEAPQSDKPLNAEDAGSQKLLEGDQTGAYLPTGVGRLSEDGYNWRKYGQKQVKGSEYPRSYYKCTHPNCQVKKKVERSHDGQITEIIYKGAHSHPKPQPNRRSALGSGLPLNEVSEIGEGGGSYAKVEGGSVWSTQQGSKDNKVGSDWRADGLERTSSTSVVTELSDPLATAPGKNSGVTEPLDAPELSSTLASLDDDEDRATQGSISLGEDADDAESDSKRRRKESCLIETNFASRAVREPRVVVQTDSEVDILEDGYRWRKYGQKVVKGNPNPRSYYKCTSAGCPVRKHVERASHDLKSVITTYEGKHNHEVPAARNSSHMNSANGNVPQAVSNAPNTLTLPGNSSIPKPETQGLDLVPRFERKPEFSSDFLKPSYLGSFTSDMKLGPSACYEMKFPPLQTALPFGLFGLNPTQHETRHMSSIPHGVPEFPIQLPMSLTRSPNLDLAGFEFNNHGKPIGLPPSFLGIQNPQETDLRLLRPKQEQKDDAVYEAHLPINHLTSASSSVYRHIMGGFPL